MGYYSDIYIHTGGPKIRDLKEWYERTNGYPLSGSGGAVETSDYSLDIVSIKWYEMESDIETFLRQLPLQRVVIWVYRKGENGFASDFVRYRFRKDGDVVTIDKSKIDMVELLVGQWKGS